MSAIPVAPARHVERVLHVPNVARPSATHIARARALVSRTGVIPSQNIDSQRPSDEDLKSLAPAVAEFETMCVLPCRAGSLRRPWHVRKLDTTPLASPRRFPSLASQGDKLIVYTAPQITVEGSILLERNRFWACIERHLLTHRGNWFLETAALPLRWCLRGCCGYEERPYLKDDVFWRELLTTGPNPDACPEHLRGLFWLQDEVVNQLLLTFQDAEWATPAPAGFAAGGIKTKRLNWARDTTLLGSILACASTSRPPAAATNQLTVFSGHCGCVAMSTHGRHARPEYIHTRISAGAALPTSHPARAQHEYTRPHHAGDPPPTLLPPPPRYRTPQV